MRFPLHHLGLATTSPRLDFRICKVQIINLFPKDIQCVKHLDRCLAHSKHSINVRRSYRDSILTAWTSGFLFVIFSLTHEQDFCSAPKREAQESSTGYRNPDQILMVGGSALARAFFLPQKLHSPVAGILKINTCHFHNGKFSLEKKKESQTFSCHLPWPKRTKIN